MESLWVYERIELLEPYQGSENDRGFVVLFKHGVKRKLSDLKLGDVNEN